MKKPRKHGALAGLMVLWGDLRWGGKPTDPNRNITFSFAEGFFREGRLI
jgi:hypothetical protein